MTVEHALAALVAKLDAVHTDETYQAVWQIAQLHLGQYTGPTYTEELNAAREVLVSGRQRSWRIDERSWTSKGPSRR